MNRKLKYDNIMYNIQEVLLDIRSLLRKCKNKTLSEEEFLVYMEHVIWHLNFSFNTRHLSRKEVSKLNQEEFEKYALSVKSLQGKPKS